MVSMMWQVEEAEQAVVRQQQQQQQQMFVSTSAASSDSWSATADYVRTQLSMIQGLASSSSVLQEPDAQLCAARDEAAAACAENKKLQVAFC